jgi:phosphomethylpyrimidine synthase
MIAKREAVGPQSGDPLPNSSRVHLNGRIHPDVRVPFREIKLNPTKTRDGGEEANAPVRVYDCSGPWGDPDFKGTVEQGLPALRRDWVLKRGDVKEYDGRAITAKDDGYLSDVHAESRDNSKFKIQNSKFIMGWRWFSSRWGC